MPARSIVCEIDRLVLAARRVLADPRREARPALRALDERVMHPVRSAMLQPGSARPGMLLVVPDGALHLVPFDALVDEEQRYLVERWQIHYLGSSRDLVRNRIGRTRTAPSLVVGAPTFDLASGGASERGLRLGGQRVHFEALPASAREAAEIAGLLHVHATVGGDAGKEALLAARGPLVLHVATHGFFLPARLLGATPPSGWTRLANPAALEEPLLRAGLALAGANRGDDGILTALELAGLDLLGTQVAVLSACDTGAGDVSTGDGVFGMRRALDAAGVATQVVSLWPVDDETTRRTMARFYRLLLDGAPRSAAMTTVRRELLARPATRHPSWWAPFIVSGDPRPLLFRPAADGTGEPR
jgi:CHAT domain-containing protein